MGLRSRIKGRLKAALGQGAADAKPAGQAVPRSAPTAPAGTMPTTSATPVPDRPLSPKLAPSEDTARQVKIDRHRVKTKAGVLSWLGQQDGGQASMADMHDYSERRFFVAHRGFSDLMEQLTGEGLVDFDPDDGRCTITDAGRAWKA